MTKEFMFFENKWQDIKFINKSRIPIPNIILKRFSSYLEPSLEPTVISRKKIYWQAR